MHATKQTSSSFKVGVLTLTAIIILIFTVMWVKGRSLSSGERIEVNFTDVNGMRAGSGVQMMGLRVGQVEEIIPVIAGKNSYVRLKFVITEDGVKIPPLSTISIQQSGLIGEQFLEITPPKNETVYVTTLRNTTSIQNGDKIYMDFEGQLKEIAEVQEFEIVETRNLRPDIRSQISTPYALRLDYMMNVAGLLFDSSNVDLKVTDGKIIFSLISGEPLKYPEKAQLYTVIEPKRISDFLEAQFRAAESLTHTNERIVQILNNDVIFEITQSVANLNILTQKAITTIDKAEALVDSSKADLDTLLNQSSSLVKKLNTLTDNVNDIVGDKDAKETILTTAKSFNRLAGNVNGILEDKQSKEIVANINEISKNMAEISTYVNTYTKDEKLKKDLTQTIASISAATKNINDTLASLNKLDDCEQLNLKSAISDAVVTTRNLKTFSEKLNKRFLLFRLMF